MKADDHLKKMQEYLRATEQNRSYDYSKTRWYYTEKYLSDLDLDEIEDERVEPFVLRLREEDDLFDLNIAWDAIGNLSTFGGRCMLDYLRKCYEVENYVIEEDIHKYAREGDTVELTVNGFVAGFFIRQQAKGVVHRDKKYEDGNTSVKFAKKVVVRVPPGDLVVYGRKQGLFRKDKSYPPTCADLFDLKKNDLVYYNPKEEEQLAGYLEVRVGSKAIVVSCDEEHCYLRWPDIPEIEKSYSIYQKYLRLIRENEIDFDKLYQAFFGGIVE